MRHTAATAGTLHRTPGGLSVQRQVLCCDRDNQQVSAEGTAALTIAFHTFAVPLSTSAGGSGTGFLGRRGGQVAFYTAAHVLTAIDLVAPTHIPIASWDWLAASIEFQLDINLPAGAPVPVFKEVPARNDTCLLYTSDAADE